MNKITKRIVASLSAAALIVSTFGSNSFSGTMMDSVYAEESATSTSNRKGRSTGFDNLEQDTNAAGEYNTGYGLHTNKTASVAEGSTDGRTFDVNLESWYVGENPVDIATILDASGSMAWTVNRLEPMDIRSQLTDDEIMTLKSKYGTLSDVNSLSDSVADCTDDSVKVALTAIQNSTTDKYLPEDVVDMIMDSNNTDNSKLSYSDYKYYVYEERSSVSEFVPLGYWDGGVANSLIGYYNFDKNLTNQVTGDSASYIQNVNSGEEFKNDSVAQIIPRPLFTDGYLDLSETDKNGNLVVDLSKLALDTDKEIEIGFKLNCDDVSKKCAPQAPILYLGDGTKDNYIALMRGRSHNTGSGASNHIYVFEGKGNETEGGQLDTYKSNGERLTKTSNGTTTETNDNDILKDKTDQELTCLWKIVKNSGVYDITLTVAGTTYKYKTDEKFTIDSKQLYLVIGGNEILPYGSLENKDEIVIDKDDLKGIKIKELTLSGTSTDTTRTDTNVKISLLLTNSSGLTDSTENISAEYNKQSIDGESITTGPQDSINAEVSFKDDALNLVQTAKNGAVLLDPAQEKLTGNEFTISFKVKKAENEVSGFKSKAVANLFYLGSLKTTGDYARIFRDYDSSSSRLKMNDSSDSTKVNINSIFSNSSEYKTITITIAGKTVKHYIGGTIDGSSSELSSEIDLSNISCIIGGLWNSEYDGADILIDDLYIFDKALDEDEVKALFSSSGSGSLLEKGACGEYHATATTGEDIAQIKDSLAQNLLDSERRGWYYVNSHSSWTDIATEGDLEGGKNYIGIYTDKGLEYCTDDGYLEATIPSSADLSNDKDYAHRIESGNTNSSSYPKYKAPTTERSIRFFLDSEGYLRCYVWSGADTKTETDPRTFCSVVYYNWADSKKDRSSVTKYEQLNEALNTFFAELAKNSDLTNSAVVRFSTNNAVDKTNKENTTENLKKLIMKDWTNWSDYYQEISKKGDTPNEDQYLHDLLIPEEGDTSLGKENSATTSGEYPYVITGGTYTWTGLKSFYDNMIVGDSDDSDPTNYNISIDARDKYLIIFTDGRDNTQDCDWNEDGTPDKDTGSNYKKTDYVNDYKPDKSDISKDGELAEAWADKIKESGYTIFCVMMATGSISPTANKEEYNKAYNFLNTLAGSDTENKEALDKAIKAFIDGYNEVIADPDSGIEKLDKNTWYEVEEDEKAWGTDLYNLYVQAKNLQDYMNSHVLIAEPGETNTTEKAFSDILAQIQQPRTDYTVQDYIDPRFNLIDKNGTLYELGPNGHIKYGTTEVVVGNIIDASDASDVYGLPFTTRNAENVNVKSVTTDEDGKRVYVDPDKNGTGYIYYDDVKDMYYLRWTDQIIPMRNSSLDTGDSTEYLDVWSATIRLKAKDDFIGGNDILTNGNEAGENLVFSEATIKNMDAYPDLYNFTVEKGLDEKYTEREKLQVLSGTDRKINAVDAGGVSQAVYGEGIDIPSSGFPRVTVNVRLLPLNSKDLNDVIYMGEVVSPTMMLADLENDYMTGSYYLEYLERYAYRLYGNKADETPLIELLNQWLRINEKDVEAKTFTIPYMYLPNPVYKADGTLDTEKFGTKTVAKVENSSGLDSADAGTSDAFDDLNLRDVTGFITYTWRRDDGSKEEQQKMEEKSPSGEDQYDITKEYVVKNTDQIKYNLQLKFTPLKTGDLTGFELDENFIQDNEKFFEVKDLEFNNTDVKEWTFTNRSQYLKAMVSETHTYEPHIIYDSDSKKWILVGTEPDAIENAKKAYVAADADNQTEEIPDINKVKDTGVYDWDEGYKPVVDKSQLDYESWNADNSYYGNAVIEDFAKGTTKVEHCTLSANTTYIKDVVNGALALELVVDGKYLKGSDSEINKDKKYTFTATRYYDDPYDPLPYSVGGDGMSMSADTGETAGEGKDYQLTFKVKEDTLPKSPKDDEFYTIWAELESVEVEDIDSTWKPIEEQNSENQYAGYKNKNALPIGTYEIKVNSADMVDNSDLEKNQYYIGKNDDDSPQFFQYLKFDNTPLSFTYNRFPQNVYSVSKTAKDSTGDSEYLIWDDSTDNASKNIAKNNRVNDSTTGTQTLKFYFGTVDKRTINGNELSNTIGYSRTDNSTEAKGNDYAKDRLGIILLSADLNSLFISKEVTHTNTKTEKYKDKFWEFTITFMPNAGEESAFTTGNPIFTLTWYKRENSSNPWKVESTPTTGYPDDDGGTTKAYPATITFDGPDSDGKYTAKIYMKHNEKVLINSLPDGIWQVVETDERSVGDKILYSAHNDMDKIDEYSWSNKTDECASLPGAGVQFTNQFPFYILSAGGSGTYLYILCGGLLLLMASVLYYLSRLRKSKSRDKPDG